MKNSFIFSLILLLFSSCEVFDPALENHRELDVMYKEPEFALGILLNGYAYLPYKNAPASDVATDDAVKNLTSDSYTKLATGSWSSQSNPTSTWTNSNAAIQYINLFLKNGDGVEYTSNPAINQIFKDRGEGEAYALRAIHLYHLLLAHGGWSSNNELLGVPIHTAPETTSSDFNQPRDTFQACVDQILSDAEKALDLLPYEYVSHTMADVPQKYIDLGISNVSEYDRVMGPDAAGKVCGKIVKAAIAQTLLLAASPAYSAGTNVTWADAAQAAADALEGINGVAGMDPTGNTWYCNIDELTNLGAGVTPAEIIWRSNYSDSYSLEAENYPPSLDGKGRINPSQELVDAFPMANGYPIDNSNANYNEKNIYENRDPRLAKYIVVNGDIQGPFNTVIYSGSDSSTLDGLNKENEKSTRTGYYLRKLLRPDCNPDPEFKTAQRHYTAYMRYTEIFLAFAEAANEAYSPTDNTLGYSAYDVVKALRQRAGIDAADPYLESIKNDKDAMRELIRNERRLELCFENIRFWDLRRWKVTLDELTAPVSGVDITQGAAGDEFNYKAIEVENRSFQDYMYYGPVPHTETQKWSNLVQNKGW